MNNCECKKRKLYPPIYTCYGATGPTDALISENKKKMVNLLMKHT